MTRFKLRGDRIVCLHVLIGWDQSRLRKCFRWNIFQCSIEIQLFAGLLCVIFDAYITLGSS